MRAVMCRSFPHPLDGAGVEGAFIERCGAPAAVVCVPEPKRLVVNGDYMPSLNLVLHQIPHLHEIWWESVVGGGEYG